jgi:hypothetical protein
LCIDPLIRNIENNEQIDRLELPSTSLPKILAYADDVTCITDTKRGVKKIFNEYERLSKASGLVLNADKTEILDKNNDTYSFKYMNDVYRIKGKSEVKINGVIFHNNEEQMEEKNYNMLVDKIDSALRCWAARRLSLLGRILIYKTFSLSQITYVLTVIELTEAHYKNLDLMFKNYLWGRDLFGGANYNRISWTKLCRPIEKGGFAMLKYKEVVDGIRCRQLGKMFSEDYAHPLKSCILMENKSFASWTCLKESADKIAKIAHSLILGSVTNNLNRMTNEEIASDKLLLQQLGEIETNFIVKINKRQSDDIIVLVHHWGCNNFRDIVRQGKEHRGVIAICRRIMTAKYFRILKFLIQPGTDPPEKHTGKLKLVGGFTSQYF